MSLLMIYSIVSLRQHLQAIYYFSIDKNFAEKTFSWLKMRTIEIEGASP